MKMCSIKNIKNIQSLSNLYPSNPIFYITQQGITGVNMLTFVKTTSVGKILSNSLKLATDHSKRVLSEGDLMLFLYFLKFVL